MASIDPPNKPITLFDIARELGITKMAVSKALRGHKDISELTRRKVEARARKLGYVPNTTSRSLRFNRSHLVGVVVPSFMYSFFSEVMEGANSVFESAEYQSVLTVSGEDPEREVRQVEALLSRQVEGLIVVSCQRRDDLEMFKRLQHRAIPFITVGRRVEKLKSCFVGVDNIAVGKIVTRHLIDCGHRRIAHLSGPQNMTSIMRSQGYREALKTAGLPVIEQFIMSGERHVVADTVRALVQRRDRPDAIFAYNDAMALEAFRVLKQAGLRIPEDVAVAGVGNNGFSDLLSSSLTTVDQHPQIMGRKAAELLLRWLVEKRKPEERNIHIPVRLVVRESSGAKTPRRG